MDDRKPLYGGVLHERLRVQRPPVAVRRARPLQGKAGADNNRSTVVEYPLPPPSPRVRMSIHPEQTQHSTDVESTNGIHASVGPFTLKVSPVGTSGLGASAKPQILKPKS